MSRRNAGVIVPLAESFVADVGEENALEVARIMADVKARHFTTGTATRIGEESLKENFPRIDPDTGEELPPQRFYRFGYLIEDDDA